MPAHGQEGVGFALHHPPPSCPPPMHAATGVVHLRPALPRSRGERPLRPVIAPLYPAATTGGWQADARVTVVGEGQSGQVMRGEPGPQIGPGMEQGMEAVLLAHRAQLMRFLESHGAGDATEDLFQELWIRVTQRPNGPVANPLAYLYRAANNLMVDRYRAERQARQRDHAWSEARGGLEEWAPQPTAEEVLIARQELGRLDVALAALGERAARCFRRFRLDGVPQKQIAAELGVSLSTVESDLRRAYAALIAARRQSDDT